MSPGTVSVGLFWAMTLFAFFAGVVLERFFDRRERVADTHDIADELRDLSDQWDALAFHEVDDDVALSHRTCADEVRAVIARLQA